MNEAALQRHLTQIRPSCRTATLQEKEGAVVLVLPNFHLGAGWEPQVADVEVTIPPLYPAQGPRFVNVPGSDPLPLSIPKWSASSSNLQTVLTAVRRAVARTTA